MDPTASRLRLTIPTEAAYKTLYTARYQPAVTALADDHTHPPTLTEFLAIRRDRMTDTTCIERVILIDDAPAGTITAFHFSPATLACELGIVLVFPHHWGQGLGPEAIRQFFDLLRRHYGVRRVALETLETNLRAQNAFRKVGFRETRRYTDPSIHQRLVVMQCLLSMPSP
jgi:RimJ/RimL family protein N-acetyltransferase